MNRHSLRLNRRRSREQWKARIEDLGNFGRRYAAANAFSLSVITVRPGILALAKPSEVLGGASTCLWVTVSSGYGRVVRRPGGFDLVAKRGLLPQAL
jgi:hypothetical protein